MPGRVGTGHQCRGRPGHGFKDLVVGGSGLQLVRPDQCDEAPATDRSGRQQVPQRRRRLAAAGRPPPPAPRPPASARWCRADGEVGELGHDQVSELRWRVAEQVDGDHIGQQPG
jgi:hypothetical protein